MSNCKNNSVNYVPFENPHCVYLWFTARASECTLKKAYRMLIAQRTLLTRSEANTCNAFEVVYANSDFEALSPIVPFKADNEEDDVVSEYELEMFTPLERFLNWKSIKRQLMNVVMMSGDELYSTTFIGFEPYEALKSNEQMSTKILRLEMHYSINGFISNTAVYSNGVPFTYELKLPNQSRQKPN